MHPISPVLARALRTGGAVRPIVHTVDATGTRTGDDLVVLSGTVQVNSGTGVRRRLNAEVADAPGLWDELAPTGTRLACAQHYPTLGEYIPLGVFDVDEQSLSHGPGGGVRVTAPDLWQLIARARFLTPQATPAEDAVAAAGRLVQDVTGITPALLGPVTGQAAAAVWPRKRDEAITSILRAAGAEGGFDVTGRPFFRPVPIITGPGVWVVDTGKTGVLLGADRSRSRQDARSVVVVTPTAVDGTAPYDPVVVEDTDPASPTFVGGPFGRVPAFYDTELIPTAEQAQIAALGILQQLRGLSSTLEVTSAPNPALDAGDVILVRTPRRSGVGGGAERYIADAFTIDLSPGGAQRITVRGSRPLDGLDGVE